MVKPETLDHLHFVYHFTVSINVKWSFCNYSNVCLLVKGIKTVVQAVALDQKSNEYLKFDHQLSTA